MCTVVNLKIDEYDVYIGRAGHGKDGYFGNPYRAIPGDPGATIPMFEEYARKRLKTDPEYRERVKALKGKRLGCFCKPRPCHGDVLVKLCAELNGE